MNVLRSKRSVAGLAAALVTMAGLTLFVVLPALASNSGDRIPPAAVPSGLVPVDVPLGGNGTCSNLFTSAVSALPSLHEYDNVNPGTATGLPSGRGDGVTFNLTLGGSLKDLPIVARTFVLATIAVPIVIYGVMPHLHRLRARLSTGAR